MMQNNIELKPKKRKLYFRILKKLMKGRYKEPTFVYLGDKISTGSVVLSNHEGTDAPMSLEIYLDRPIRMWGAHEMNSGLISLYKYQTKIYYCEKKHWNIHLARLFCLIASPLTNLFYSGLELISTYKDIRFVKTVRESITALKAGDNIVIYPEDSKDGYKEQLDGFQEGFTLLADTARKQGIDVPIYVGYFRKRDCVYVIDKPVYYSQLVSLGKAGLAEHLCERCNELGRMTFDDKVLALAKEGRDNLAEYICAEEKEEKIKIS